MTDITRRALLQQGMFSVATLLSLNATRRSAFGQFGGGAKFTMSLRCHSIGVQADQMKAIRLAHKHGYDAVVPDARFLADLTDDARAQLLDDMKDKKLGWGAAGLPVSFGGDDERFEEGLKRLPRLAGGLQRAGVTRIGTAIGSAHSKLTYMANFRHDVVVTKNLCAHRVPNDTQSFYCVQSPDKILNRRNIVVG